MDRLSSSKHLAARSRVRLFYGRKTLQERKAKTGEILHSEYQECFLPLRARHPHPRWSVEPLKPSASQ